MGLYTIMGGHASLSSRYGILVFFVLCNNGFVASYIYTGKNSRRNKFILVVYCRNDKNKIECAKPFISHYNYFMELVLTVVAISLCCFVPHIHAG